MPKPYNIDSMLALPSNTEFASALYQELGEMISREEWLNEGAEANAYDAYECNLKINFNGFDGWFMNSAAMLLRDAHAALLAVGANQRAELLKFAMGIFPNAEPPEDESYMTIVENLTPEQKAALDNLFSHFTKLDYDDSPENLPMLLRKYVEEHIQDFK